MTDTYEFTVQVRGGTRRWAQQVANVMHNHVTVHMVHCKQANPDRTPDLEIVVTTPRKVTRRPFDHELGDKTW